MNFRRIVHCIGHAGEHYLTRTRDEYVHALAASCGAGAIFGATVVFKALITRQQLPYVLEATLYGLNYGTSFVLVQFLGFWLATKQSTLLAAALVRKQGLHHVRARFAAAMRSQFAAFFGNFALVTALMLAFGVGFRLFTGKSFLSHEEASHAISSLRPIESGTAVYAALTGCLLWLSGLVSGWAAIQARKLRFSSWYRKQAHGGRRTIDFLLRHTGGIGFNLTLAFFLSALPLLGKLTGIAIEIRHFTLASGALSLAITTTGLQGAWGAGLWPAAIGVVTIGLLNFSVSFTLSAALGLVTHRKGRSWRKLVSTLLEIARHFARAPWEFILPYSPRYSNDTATSP